MINEFDNDIIEALDAHERGDLANAPENETTALIRALSHAKNSVAPGRTGLRQMLAHAQPKRSPYMKFLRPLMLVPVGVVVLILFVLTRPATAPTTTESVLTTIKLPPATGNVDDIATLLTETTRAEGVALMSQSVDLSQTASEQAVTSFSNDNAENTL